MPWFARKERPGLPATVSARMSWPRFGPPRAGTRGTGPQRFQAVQEPRARSTDALTYAGPRKNLHISSSSREALTLHVVGRRAVRVLAGFGRLGIGIGRGHGGRPGSGFLVEHLEDIGPDHVGCAGLGIDPHGVGLHGRSRLARAHLLHDLDEAAVLAVGIDQVVVRIIGDYVSL